MKRALTWILAVFSGTAAFCVPSLAMLASLTLPVTGSLSGDPVVGVWKLNRDKSDMATAFGYTDITRKYESAGGGIRVTETRTDRPGHTTQIRYAVHYDGRPYPVYTADGEKGAFRKSDETMELRRLDRYTVAGVARRNGNIAYTFTRVLSGDAQTLMVRMVEVDSQRKERITLLVYERFTLT